MATLESQGNISGLPGLISSDTFRSHSAGGYIADVISSRCLMRVVRPGVVTLFDFARGALLVLGLVGVLFFFFDVFCA